MNSFYFSMRWKLFALPLMAVAFKVNATCGDPFIASIAPTMSLHYNSEIRQGIGRSDITTDVLAWDRYSTALTIPVNLYLMQMCPNEYAETIRALMVVDVKLFSNGLPLVPPSFVGYPAVGIYPNSNHIVRVRLDLRHPLIRGVLHQQLFDPMASFPDIKNLWESWARKHKNSTNPTIKKFLKDNFSDAVINGDNRDDRSGSLTPIGTGATNLGFNTPTSGGNSNNGGGGGRSNGGPSSVTGSSGSSGGRFGMGTTNPRQYP